jgi:LemA protein
VKEVIQDRAVLLASRKRRDEIDANVQLTATVQRLLAALDQSYPRLKPTVAFGRLEDEIAGAENRLAVDRRDYNEAIQRYNTDLQLFPGNVVAVLFGLKRDDNYFRTAE